MEGIDGVCPPLGAVDDPIANDLFLIGVERMLGRHFVRLDLFPEITLVKFAGNDDWSALVALHGGVASAEVEFTFWLGAAMAGEAVSGEDGGDSLVERIGVKNEVAN